MAHGGVPPGFIPEDDNLRALPGGPMLNEPRLDNQDAMNADDNPANRPVEDEQDDDDIEDNPDRELFDNDTPNVSSAGVGSDSSQTASSESGSSTGASLPEISSGSSIQHSDTFTNISEIGSLQISERPSGEPSRSTSADDLIDVNVAGSSGLSDPTHEEPEANEKKLKTSDELGGAKPKVFSPKKRNKSGDGKAKKSQEEQLVPANRVITSPDTDLPIDQAYRKLSDSTEESSPEEESKKIVIKYEDDHDSKEKRGLRSESTDNLLEEEEIKGNVENLKREQTDGTSPSKGEVSPEKKQKSR